jgi:IS5 family transposase
MFDEVQRQLAAKGMRVATGTIVDTTVINAAVATPANVADSTAWPELLHGHETHV